jgi:uncharacterized membrane protein
MTDRSRPTDDKSVITAAGVAADEYGVVAEGGIAMKGNQALLVARFGHPEAAGAAYEALRQAERDGAIDINGVLVVDADDFEGRIRIRKLTDHHTRNGLMWGAVGGAALALIFPPSLLAGAAFGGVVGAAAGKVGNVVTKADLAEDLADVITPGTSGIVAVIDLSALEAVKDTIGEADDVRTVPVDDETAAIVSDAAQAAAAESPPS